MLVVGLLEFQLIMMLVNQMLNTIAAFALLIESFKLVYKIHMLLFVVFGHGCWFVV